MKIKILQEVPAFFQKTLVFLEKVSIKMIQLKIKIRFSPKASELSLWLKMLEWLKVLQKMEGKTNMFSAFVVIPVFHLKGEVGFVKVDFLTAGCCLSPLIPSFSFYYFSLSLNQILIFLIFLHSFSL